MESTGIYWKALYCEMEEAGLHPELINPRHFHSAEEGRKTDKTDAKWLANLARLGLYRASFIPVEPMRTLRLYVVALHKITTERIADTNRLTKILDDSGIHFSRVSGRIYLRNILNQALVRSAPSRGPELHTPDSYTGLADSPGKVSLPPFPKCDSAPDTRARLPTSSARSNWQ